MFAVTCFVTDGSYCKHCTRRLLLGRDFLEILLLSLKVGKETWGLFPGSVGALERLSAISTIPCRAFHPREQCGERTGGSS